MNNTAGTTRFFSYRTLLGLLAGIIAALIFTIFFQQPGQFTPIISLLLAIWVSNLSKSKHLAGLGALIGTSVGIVYGIQATPQNSGLLEAYFTVSLAMIVWAAIFAFLGFLLAQFIKLYKRGAVL